MTVQVSTDHRNNGPTFEENVRMIAANEPTTVLKMWVDAAITQIDFLVKKEKCTLEERLAVCLIKVEAAIYAKIILRREGKMATA